MPSLGGTRFTNCPASRWTSLWDGPTFGFTYLWSASGSVQLRWRRWSSGIPWYSEGTITVGGQTTVPHGGPSVYLRLEVMPDRDATLRAT
jgi:hypothetical protein